MSVSLEEIALGYDRIEAAQACRNLMGLYSHYHTASRQHEYIDLWAKRDDCILEMPWGIYKGYEGVRACYLRDHADRSLLGKSDDPRINMQLYGGLFMHAMDTEVIEVAADCKTARGAWISPGHETFVDPEGEAHCEWCWGKYAVDFIKDSDGRWRFWHMRLFPLFKAPYKSAWINEKKFDPSLFPQDPSILPPSSEAWGWAVDAVYPPDQPEPPLPYKTFDDVGYSL